jgi:hypothetical protein
VIYALKKFLQECLELLLLMQVVLYFVPLYVCLQALRVVNLETFEGLVQCAAGVVDDLWEDAHNEEDRITAAILQDLNRE